MLKRITALLLATTLLTACLTGCGAKNAAKSDAKPTIAYLGSDTGSTDNVIFANSMRGLCNLVDFNVVFTPDETYDADSCISFVENQISAGADGLLFCPPSDSVLLTIMNLCEEAEVYWAIVTRSITDDSVRQKVEASPYYVGNCYEDEYETGYNVMEKMNDLGYKKFAIISTAKGNTTCDAREEAIAQACKDFGMEMIAEARDFTQASEVMVACQSFLAAYEDIDSIFIVGTYATGAPAAAVKAIEESGRADKVKLVAVDYDLTEGLVECFSSGVLALDVIGMQYDPFCAAAKVINAVSGTPLTETNFETQLGLDYITEINVAKQWEEVYSNPTTQYMTEDEMKQLLKKYNKELDAEEFNKLVNSWNPID